MICKSCGSHDVRPAKPTTKTALMERFLRRGLLRCHQCGETYWVYKPRPLKPFSVLNMLSKLVIVLIIVYGLLMWLGQSPEPETVQITSTSGESFDSAEATSSDQQALDVNDRVPDQERDSRTLESSAKADSQTKPAATKAPTKETRKPVTTNKSNQPASVAAKPKVPNTKAPVPKQSKRQEVTKAAAKPRPQKSSKPTVQPSSKKQVTEEPKINPSLERGVPAPSYAYLGKDGDPIAAPLPTPKERQAPVNEPPQPSPAKRSVESSSDRQVPALTPAFSQPLENQSRSADTSNLQPQERPTTQAAPVQAEVQQQPSRFAPIPVDNQLAKIEVVETGQGVEIRLLPANRYVSKSMRFRSFNLPVQNSFVVDLVGKWSRSPAVTDVVEGDGRFVHRMRIGEHSRYMRIVMDLVSAKDANPMVMRTDSGLAVRFSKR